MHAPRRTLPGAHRRLAQSLHAKPSRQLPALYVPSVHVARGAHVVAAAAAAVVATVVGAGAGANVVAVVGTVVACGVGMVMVMVGAGVGAGAGAGVGVVAGAGPGVVGGATARTLALLMTLYRPVFAWSRVCHSWSKLAGGKPFCAWNEASETPETPTYSLRVSFHLAIAWLVFDTGPSPSQKR